MVWDFGPLEYDNVVIKAKSSDTAWCTVRYSRPRMMDCWPELTCRRTVLGPMGGQNSPLREEARPSLEARVPARWPRWSWCRRRSYILTISNWGPALFLPSCPVIYSYAYVSFTLVSIVMHVWSLIPSARMKLAWSTRTAHLVMVNLEP